MKFAEFYKRYLELKNSLPKVPTHNLRCANCDQGDYNYSSKNCVFCFDNAELEDCLHSFDSYRLKQSADCDFCVESELLYEGVDCFRCYNSVYLDYCGRVRDSYFCWDCSDCQNLFGCTHLKHKQYCIFNKQYKKEEYFRRVKALLNQPPEENLAKLEKLIGLYPYSQTHVTHSENCDYGNHVHYSKNCYLCFDAARNEDCGYLYDSHRNLNSYDLTQTVQCELTYESSDSARLYSCFFTDYCSDCSDCGFCFKSTNLDSCFGCVNLRNKKYCLLNQQLTKIEYEKVVTDIKKDLNQTNASFIK